VKLILCRECHDVVKLIPEEKRHCYCGKAWGQYHVDGLNAVYGGETAIALGFHNDSLISAVKSRPERGPGRDFKAFVIPKYCSTLEFFERA
jgi:hypothetical protein